MFCPECHAEYEPGILKCADCNVPLVPEPPANQEPEFVEFEEILATYNPADIAMIKSLLDGENIDYYFHGELFNYLEPPVQPARLMVSKEQADDAREILQDMNIAYTVSLEDKGTEKKN